MGTLLWLTSVPGMDRWLKKWIDRVALAACPCAGSITHCLGGTFARTLAQWPHKRGLSHPLPDLRGQNPKYRDACVPLSSGLDFGILLAVLFFFFLLPVDADIVYR